MIKFNKMTFETLYETLPSICKKKLDNLKEYRENPLYHPEENCYEHIRIVTERCILTQNMNLVCAGVLHDICKCDVSEINPLTGYPKSPGHEEQAGLLIERDNQVSKWIETMGANFHIVHYLVTEHMRIKMIKEMRKSKVHRMEIHPWFPMLVVFTNFDSMRTSKEDLEYFTQKGIEL